MTSQVVPPPCNLVYVDLGTNNGGSILDFVHGRAEQRVLEMLRAATDGIWSPTLMETTCIYGFEPNPQHTQRLRDIEATLLRGKAVGNITIYTTTAVGGPEQAAAPMWLVVASGRGGPANVATHLAVTKPKSATGSVTPVRTFCLSDWLRHVCLPRHGSNTPVMMRLDIEGSEYDVLSDLATSGIGRAMNLFVTLEWHPYSPTTHSRAELAQMAQLDDLFMRYPNRCSGGLCSHPVSNNWTQEQESQMQGGSLLLNQRKTLAFMLHRAGITFVDAFYDVLALSYIGKRPSSWNRTLSVRDWNATRVRRAQFLARTSSRVEDAPSRARP